jgi:hypothetical protein
MNGCNLIGRTVALTLCPAHAEDGTVVVISGLYDVEDMDSNERGGPWFLVYPFWQPCCINVLHDRLDCKAAGLPEDQQCEHCNPRSYDIDADILHEQVDPQGYGLGLALERDLELAMEDQDQRERREISPGVWRAG